MEEIPENYYPPKELANLIWGICFNYEDINKKDIKNKIKQTCFLIEQIYNNKKIQNENRR
jgi:hypothetical protein